jgi:hypothetical protein
MIISGNTVKGSQAGTAASIGSGPGSGASDNRIQLVANGDFGADAVWAKVTWTIAAGVGTIAGAGTGTLTQTIAITPGVVYQVTFTVTSFTGGTVTISLGGTNGTARGSAATFVENIKAGTTNQNIVITGTAATLSIDNVTVLQTG